MQRQFTLRQAYLLCFFFLMIWALFAYAIMNTQIQGGVDYAEMINTSGRQRMFSQRTAMLAFDYLNNADSVDLGLLQQEIALMRSQHNSLIVNLPSNTLKELYFSAPHQLDSKVTQYFDLLDIFLHSPSSQMAKELYHAADALLPELDAAVQLYEQESHVHAAKLIRLEDYIFFGTLLVLFLEALLILRPILRKADLSRKQMEEMVNRQTESLRIYERIFARANDGIMITDESNRIIDLNSALEDITGFRRDELLGESPSQLKSTHLDTSFYTSFWDELLDKGSWTGEFINRRKDGSVYYQNSYVFVLRDSEGNVVRHVGIVRDISKDKRGTDMLENLALYDFLTGLPNRTSLQGQMPKAIERAKRFQKKLATVLFDLDNFKEINDSLGHRVGDLVLEEIGQRLANCVRSSDMVARLGGDEFVLLVELIDKQEDLEQVMVHVRQSLEAPLMIGGQALTVTCSMGASLYPDDADNQDTMLEHADAAMYHVKKSGKNQYSIYDSETMVDIFTSHNVSRLTGPPE